MDQWINMKKMMDVASGRRKASLVLKNAKVINVFTEEIETLDIAIEDGRIAGLGSYEGIENRDMTGRFVCPGFIDGHIHLESSMVSPDEFETAVLPHGTTAVITDPHEISNVAGLQGLDYMLEATEKRLLDVYFMLPSCVPAAPLDKSGAVLEAKDLKSYYNNPRVLGLAEVMNAPGVINGQKELLEKLLDSRAAGKIADGHAPFLSGRDLCAYVCAGIRSDHECSDPEEAKQKLARGQWIMIREGTAARNLSALLPLFEAPYYERCMLVTDDRHPGDLVRLGHMDYILRRAVALGADPIRAIRMATLHEAQYFGLKDRGAVAPGMKADLAVLEDLKDFRVLEVYKNGMLAAQNGTMAVSETPSTDSCQAPPPADEKRYPAVFDSFHIKEISEEDFRIKRLGPTQRIIQLEPHELLTEERLELWPAENVSGVCVERDIIKAAVFERHHHTGHVGLGFIGGYGLKKGAIATSVAHDSHNLIVAGTNDRDMALAANAVCRNPGGLAVAADGQIRGALALPIGGIMAEQPAALLDETLEFLKEQARALGVQNDIDAFMTLAFVSLPVIPKLRLNTCGIIDVEKQETVPASY